MSKLRKILGTSTISLLLVIWGLFMVCSGRVPDVNVEDDFARFEQDNQEQDQNDIMTQLAMLDDQSTKLEDNQRQEILEALGIDPTGSDMSRKEEEEFLTEELFLDLEVEIAELEKLSKHKTSVIDSLRLELQEADHQLTALGKVVGEPVVHYATDRTAPKISITNGSSSDYALFYQDALDDVYGHRYTTAIAKFEDLLKLNDTNNLADNCQYWMGESYYALGNYELAIAEFEKVYAFENNNKADDAQFIIGMEYLKIGEHRLAQIELNNLLIFYENSEYITKAEQQLLDLNI
ncbi:MAG: tol-pal system YbgF family protein [bacterium]